MLARADRAAERRSNGRQRGNAATAYRRAETTFERGPVHRRQGHPATVGP
jgi:hypothetical protein